jgi:CheY-like chemotaxis protein
MSPTTTHNVGTVLIISRDDIASQQISDVLQEHALSPEISFDISSALDRLARHKYEALVVDLFLGTQVGACLEQIRISASNRTAVTFAISSSEDDIGDALKQGFNFVLERPLSHDSISHTLKVAYGLIVRERRRYFRFPVSVPVVLNRKTAPEVYGRTINISERGVALRASIPLDPGSEGTAQFTLPDPPLAITAESRVCWSNEKGEVGLSFLFLPFDLASELQAWLAQKLEEEIPQLVADKFRQSGEREKPSRP